MGITNVAAAAFNPSDVMDAKAEVDYHLRNDLLTYNDKSLIKPSNWINVIVTTPRSTNFLKQIFDADSSWSTSGTGFGNNWIENCGFQSFHISKTIKSYWGSWWKYHGRVWTFRAGNYNINLIQIHITKLYDFNLFHDSHKFGWYDYGTGGYSGGEHYLVNYLSGRTHPYSSGYFSGRISMPLDSWNYGYTPTAADNGNGDYQSGLLGYLYWV